MSETKFTPGPWLSDQTLVYTLTPVLDATGKPEFWNGKPVVENAWSAHVTRNKHNISWPELVANTYLIAAAPDLYEALAAIVDHETNKRDFFTWGKKVDAATAALKKARGET